MASGTYCNVTDSAAENAGFNSAAAPFATSPHLMPTDEHIQIKRDAFEFPETVKVKTVRVAIAALDSGGPFHASTVYHPSRRSGFDSCNLKS